MAVAATSRTRKGIGGGVNTLPLVAPSVGLLLLFSLVPLAMTLWFSFQRYNLLNPDISGFAGFNNYKFLLRDPTLLNAVLVTVLLVGEVLVISLVFGTLLAVLFENRFPGRGIARVLMISPFFVMPTVASLVWKNLLMHPVNGLFAAFAHAFGFAPIDFFGDWPLSSVVMIVSWEWTPFAFLILLTALQSLDESTLEAARIDGAGWWDTFRHIQVPHLGRSIAVVIMIETIFLLSVFAEIYVTTSGGPGIATTNLAFLIYQRALLAFNVGAASAAGVFAIIVANIMAAFLVRTVAKRLDV